jgi:hypothetical protein
MWWNWSHEFNARLVGKGKAITISVPLHHIQHHQIFRIGSVHFNKDFKEITITGSYEDDPRIIKYEPKPDLERATQELK